MKEYLYPRFSSKKCSSPCSWLWQLRHLSLASDNTCCATTESRKICCTCDRYSDSVSAASCCSRQYEESYKLGCKCLESLEWQQTKNQQHPYLKCFLVLFSANWCTCVNYLSSCRCHLFSCGCYVVAIYSPHHNWCWQYSTFATHEHKLCVCVAKKVLKTAVQQIYPILPHQRYLYIIMVSWYNVL